MPRNSNQTVGRIVLRSHAFDMFLQMVLFASVFFLGFSFFLKYPACVVPYVFWVIFKKVS